MRCGGAYEHLGAGAQGTLQGDVGGGAAHQPDKVVVPTWSQGGGWGRGRESLLVAGRQLKGAFKAAGQPGTSQAASKAPAGQQCRSQPASQLAIQPGNTPGAS